MGLSFLKNAASTLTRLMRRLTCSSSRTTSWPKTSTRPASIVNRPAMRRMSVDLPDPFAPSTPWISPRSRRIDTSTTASTGTLRRPTTNDLLTWSTSRAGVWIPARDEVGERTPVEDEIMADSTGRWRRRVRGRTGRAGPTTHNKAAGGRPTAPYVGVRRRRRRNLPVRASRARADVIAPVGLHAASCGLHTMASGSGVRPGGPSVVQAIHRRPNSRHGVRTRQNGLPRTP